MSLTGHARFSLARAREAEQTTTQHRPLCTRPGWTVARSGAMRGVDIARCLSCGAVELRTATT